MTLLLCFLTACIEGIDLQSMGIAAPGIRTEFGLAPQQLGNVLFASPIGLFFGAFIGGRLADQFGRKAALLFAMVVFGVFQLSTVWAPGYGALVAIRFLCGLGLGGALPNLIALTSEASGGKNSILNVVITAAGMPVGGGFASWIMFAEGAHANWRTVFYIGGIAPLVLAVAMTFLLRESRVFREAREAAVKAGRRINSVAVLFGGGRAPASVSLWISFFFTTLVTYLLLNWLPILMEAKGFSRTDAAFIQILFNVGSAVGSIFMGWLMQRRPSRTILIACYVGLALGLVALAKVGGSVGVASAVVGITGAFLLSAQYILYGLSPSFYPSEARGTGTGAAVAVGRLGSAMGPQLAGMLIQGGKSATEVLQALLPVTAVAGLFAVVLMFCRRAED
ncbi:MAG: 3-(3-hydroxy-phenyl)propionate transporter MhpT [Caulobacteraceae bacterium]